MELERNQICVVHHLTVKFILILLLFGVFFFPGGWGGVLRKKGGMEPNILILLHKANCSQIVF